MSEMMADHSEELLHVRLGRPEVPVDLQLLEGLAEHLRAAFREILGEGAQGKTRVQLLVRDVRHGSLCLAVEPSFIGDHPGDAGAVSQTLIDDLNSLEQETARPTIGSNLLAHYKALVDIGMKAGGLELRYLGSIASVSEESGVAFQAVLRDQPEAGSCVAGWIEVVNIHHRPWTFSLYTKLDRQRVECRFQEEDLECILDLMERKALVEAVGEGRYGPVGVTPRQVDLSEPPRALVSDPEALLSFRRSAEITHPGETAAAALARIRTEAEGIGQVPAATHRLGFFLLHRVGRQGGH